MKNSPSLFKVQIFLALIFLLPAKYVFAQAEFRPWGNLEGIRVKGQLMEFNTRLVVVGQNWKKISVTGKELQKPKYTRQAKGATVNTQIGNLDFTEVVKDAGNGYVVLNLKFIVLKDTTVKGVYFNISLPETVYQNSQVKLNGNEQKFDQSKMNQDSVYFQSSAKKISLEAKHQRVEFQMDTVTTVIARQDNRQKFIRLYLPVCSGKLNQGLLIERSYRIKVSGDIDQSTATLKLDTSVQGRTFAGLGGNFRIQNPKLDPLVIDYCLKNLRVAWGRVEMPWSAWQPDSSLDPSAVDTSKQNIRVRKAMEMAQRLSQMNIPVIVTAWFPPAWAAEGKLSFGKSPQGIWGNPLNKASMPLIYKSITSYILYLKKYYGVNVQFFSFNESDLGINVRQTPEEHDELIKGLGSYFKSAGLKTKLLLGDNSDATTYKFTYPAINDVPARPFMGAVSFHSWRGWDTGTLQKWAVIADITRLPLIVGEGSIDAAAYAYPQYFEDPSYALEEINLYVRIMTICQPLSILQWQLTTDYSPLRGGGIFDNNGPLQPTQRFWNLKQLASTPKNLHYMPLTTNKADISCTALGDNAKHIYTIHLVNNAASRNVHLTGLPHNLKELKMYVTDNTRAAKQIQTIPVKNQQCDFQLEARCFTSLVSE